MARCEPYHSVLIQTKIVVCAPVSQDQAHHMALVGTILVSAPAVIIGFIMGAVGIGGILLIVPLTLIAKA